jgi:hypothetical protein
LLVQDVINLMERHFDSAELGGVVAEVDKLFACDLMAWLARWLGRPPRGSETAMEATLLAVETRHLSSAR